MAFRELLSTGDQGRDYKGGKNALRKFQVDADTADAALADPNIPAFLSQHPSQPTLKLDRLNATPLGEFGVFEVTANYSTDLGGAFASFPQKDAIGYYRIYTGIIEGELKVPAFVERTVTVTSGTQTQELTIYDAVKLTTPWNRPSISVEVTLPALTITQINAIVAQTFNLHQISGTVYLFESAAISDLDKDRQVIRYTWSFDRDTPAIPENQVPPEAKAPDIVRPAYSEWVGIPAAPPAVPTFGTFSPYNRTDLEGWRTLPGMPNL